MGKGSFCVAPPTNVCGFATLPHTAALVETTVTVPWPCYVTMLAESPLQPLSQHTWPPPHPPPPHTARPLIWVECLVERPSRSRTDYVVKARSQFKERSVATNVEIILPLPSDATAPVTRCSQVRVVKECSTGQE